MLHLLSDTPSVVNRYVTELRNVHIQKDRMRFRHNMERIGSFIGYEISKKLTFDAVSVETPLGSATTDVYTDRIVLATILRAGLPLHNGLLHAFDEADNAFVSAYRKHHRDGTFEIEVEYLSCPDLEGATLIVSDPMLATGASMVLATKALLEYGKPASLHFVSAIAARLGYEYLHRHFPDADIWIAAMDEELTAKSYIVPGLGDAGDLSYGAKLQE
ncbi:MAG: uracil phosphoribosyltransferase [Saprospiraceae bacterium]